MKKPFILTCLVFLLISCNLPGAGGSPPAPTLTPTEMPLPTTTPSVTPQPMLVCREETCLEAGVTMDYLIVTRPVFIDALTPFINWKTGQGFHVGLVTVDWLDSAYPGRHLAEKMKTGMHELRKRTGVVYVLLVGDTAIPADDFRVSSVLYSYKLSIDFNVPTGFYRRLDDDPSGEVLPSDAYFVEDRDWDPANTGVNPRPDNMATGEGTLQADLYLGRWSVQEPAQIAPLFEKTRSAGLAGSIFFSADKTLYDGETTLCTSWPPAWYESFACYLDAVIVARDRFFKSYSPHITTESSFVDLTDPGQASAFLERFLSNQGVMVVVYHGSYDCWQLSEECIPSAEIRFENIFPLLEGEACSVSAFYFDEGISVSESLSLAPTGPAVFSQAPNPVLYLKALRDGEPVGKAFWQAASAYLYWPNPILLLGDPSLVIFGAP